MNFNNLKMNFFIEGDATGTSYSFGNSEIKILNDEENYEFIYRNSGEIKIIVFTDELPIILRSQIKELYNGFDVDSHTIQSCIFSIQSYLKRCVKNQ